MSRMLKITFLVVFLLGLGLAGTYLYQTQFADNLSIQPKDQEKTGEAPPDYADNIGEYTGTKIEGEGIFVGKFLKAEGGKVFFEEKSEARELPAKDEINILCTKQVIGDKASLNYEQITSFEAVSLETLNEKISSLEPIIILTTKTAKGTFIADSIASSRCGIRATSY